MNIIIRKINIFDFNNYKIHIKSNFSKDYFENFINKILNNNHYILVIEYNNKIIGSGTLLIEEKLTYSGCKMGHIENILIDEDMRGKKYGTQLINELIDIADQQKCYRVDLTCNEDIIDFYKNIGFDKKLLCMSLLNKHNFTTHL